MKKTTIIFINADLELPMLTGFTEIPGYPDPVPTFDDLRMVDHDVILVRTDVDTANPAAANYSHYLSETIGGVEVDFTRGWAAVDADVCGTTYRFVNTHLETEGDAQSIFRVVQAAQMQELLTILSYETNPILLVGDFNSSPEHVPDAELSERIDLVLLKPQDREITRAAGMTTGDKPFSMTPGGLWPSDHAGVVMRIEFAAPE